MPEPTSLHEHTHFLPHLLELDAVVHESVTRAAIRAGGVHTTDAEVTSIFDIGAGTGAGTFALAAEYPGARVVAVDVNQVMLDRIGQSAEDRGIADRIDTLRLDIGDAGFGADVADMVWSSNMMHEVPDHAAAFQNVVRGLRRGGVFLLVELDTPPTVLPQEYAHVEMALRAATGADSSRPDWTGALAEAGFELLDTQTLTSDQVLPADGPGGAYAAVELRRLMHHPLPTLDDAAASTLREITADLSGRHERIDHVHIRGARTLWVARRP